MTYPAASFSIASSNARRLASPVRESLNAIANVLSSSATTRINPPVAR
jgi:hypothetical protein